MEGGRMTDKEIDIALERLESNRGMMNFEDYIRQRSMLLYKKDISAKRNAGKWINKQVQTEYNVIINLINS